MFTGKPTLGILLFVLLMTSLSCAAQTPVGGTRGPERYVFPTEADIVDVRRDFGARGDGVTDDTDALRKAIAYGIEKHSRYASPCFVYFPSGTYLISGPLESRVEEFGWSGGWRAGMILVGESREKSVIKLADRAPGYNNPQKPKWVVATGSESDARTKPGERLTGGGNRAFRHSLINLTIDTGQGNPGAIALDYVANNRGTIEDVTLRSGDGQGYCGLGLERNWPGPALVKRLTIEGFDYGIRVHHYQYSMTFEHIELRNQNKAGIRNTDNVLAIRGLRSVNKVPVIEAVGNHGQIVLLDSEWQNIGDAPAAIINSGMLLLRRVTSTGYATIVANRTRNGEDLRAEQADQPYLVKQYLAGRTWSPAGAVGAPLDLPIEETPEYNTTDLTRWVNARSFYVAPPPATQPASQPANAKAKPVVPDIGEALQAAIDAGKEIVYLPNGDYRTSRTIVIRGSVRKIMGMHSSLVANKGVDPLLRFESAGTVVVEHLRLGGTIEHNGSGALALRHVDFDRYINTPRGTGRVFFEDTIGKPILLAHPQAAWGRQVNCEFGDDPLIENHGGTLWLLGFKTEGEMTCIATYGGKTEVFGALLYPLKKLAPARTPAFLNEDGQLSLTYRMNGGDYPLHVSERLNGVTKELTSGMLKARGATLYTTTGGAHP